MNEISRRVNAKSVMLSNANHDALEKMGKFGETFNDVVGRLIYDAGELQKWKKAYEELRSQVVGLSICYECDEKWFVDSPSAMDPEVAHCENCGATGRKIKVFGQ